MYTYYSYKELRLLVRRAKCGDADAADSLRATAVEFMTEGLPLPSPVWEWIRDGLVDRHPNRLFPPRRDKIPDAPLGPSCERDMAHMVETLRRVGVPITQSRLSPGAYAIVADKFGVTAEAVRRAHLDYKRASGRPFQPGQPAVHDDMISGEVLLQRLRAGPTKDAAIPSPEAKPTEANHE